jgi:hypothetical protein
MQPGNLHDIKFNFRKGWLLAFSILVIGSLLALINVSNDTCGEYIPILLSRALTTDPYRGATLVFCLFAAFSSVYLNSILLSVGFFGFFSAFLVSMFQTAASHDALILVSSILVLWECWPENNTLWRVHWWFTVFAGAICSGWFIYIVYGCEPIPWEEKLPMPESVRCARCSWWFVSEYVCFWSMFMLVYWKIDSSLVWHDKFAFRPLRQKNNASEEEEDEKEHLIKQETRINF